MKPMIKLPTRSPTRSRQHGVALVTGLIFLVVLTLIGITAARMASLEARMSGNTRDRSLAMQAAEMALRDAEQDIQGLGTSPRTQPILGIIYFYPNCNQLTGQTYDDGLCSCGSAGNGYAIDAALCAAPPGNSPLNGYNAPVWTMVSMTGTPSVQYGTFTGAGGIPLVSAQPRYLIEGLKKNQHGGESFYYRITTRAQGANPNTVVMLQELFKP